MQHLRKFISLFHKEHPDKSTATSKVIDITPPIARPTISPNTKLIKQKQGCSIKNVSKYAKRNDFYNIFDYFSVIKNRE